MDGLGLVEYFNNEEICVENIQVFMWYMYYSLEWWAPPPDQNMNLDYWYNATYSFTQMMGSISPVLRKCYTFSADNELQWVLITERIFNIENFLIALRQNLITSHTEIDDLSWGAFLKLYQGDKVEGFRLGAKMVNLMVL